MKMITRSSLRLLLLILALASLSISLNPLDHRRLKTASPRLKQEPDKHDFYYNLDYNSNAKQNINLSHPQFKTALLAGTICYFTALLFRKVCGPFLRNIWASLPRRHEKRSQDETEEFWNAILSIHNTQTEMRSMIERVQCQLKEDLSRIQQEITSENNRFAQKMNEIDQVCQSLPPSVSNSIDKVKKEIASLLRARDDFYDKKLTVLEQLLRPPN